MQAFSTFRSANNNNNNNLADKPRMDERDDEDEEEDDGYDSPEVVSCDGNSLVDNVLADVLNDADATLAKLANFRPASQDHLRHHSAPGDVIQERQLTGSGIDDPSLFSVPSVNFMSNGMFTPYCKETSIDGDEEEESCMTPSANGISSYGHVLHADDEYDDAPVLKIVFEPVTSLKSALRRVNNGETGNAGHTRMAVTFDARVKVVFQDDLDKHVRTKYGVADSDDDTNDGDEDGEEEEEEGEAVSDDTGIVTDDAGVDSECTVPADEDIQVTQHVDEHSLDLSPATNAALDEETEYMSPVCSHTSGVICAHTSGTTCAHGDTEDDDLSTAIATADDITVRDDVDSGYYNVSLHHKRRAIAVPSMTTRAAMATPSRDEETGSSPVLVPVPPTTPVSQSAISSPAPPPPVSLIGQGQLDTPPSHHQQQFSATFDSNEQRKPQTEHTQQYQPAATKPQLYQPPTVQYQPGSMQYQPFVQYQPVQYQYQPSNQQQRAQERTSAFSTVQSHSNHLLHQGYQGQAQANPNGFVVCQWVMLKTGFQPMLFNCVPYAEDTPMSGYAPTTAQPINDKAPSAAPNPASDSDTAKKPVTGERQGTSSEGGDYISGMQTKRVMEQLGSLRRQQANKAGTTTDAKHAIAGIQLVDTKTTALLQSLVEKRVMQEQERRLSGSSESSTAAAAEEVYMYLPPKMADARPQESTQADQSANVYEHLQRQPPETSHHRRPSTRALARQDRTARGVSPAAPAMRHSQSAPISTASSLSPSPSSSISASQSTPSHRVSLQHSPDGAFVQSGNSARQLTSIRVLPVQSEAEKGSADSSHDSSNSLPVQSHLSGKDNDSPISRCAASDTSSPVSLYHNLNTPRGVSPAAKQPNSASPSAQYFNVKATASYNVRRPVKETDIVSDDEKSSLYLNINQQQDDYVNMSAGRPGSSASASSSIDKHSDSPSLSVSSNKPAAAFQPQQSDLGRLAMTHGYVPISLLLGDLTSVQQEKVMVNDRSSSEPKKVKQKQKLFASSADISKRLHKK